MAGWEILKISDGNMIGLALIMEVIKAGSAILINLPHCQREEIIEASDGMTTESCHTSILLEHIHMQHKGVCSNSWSFGDVYHLMEPNRNKAANVGSRKTRRGDKAASRGSLNPQPT